MEFLMFLWHHCHPGVIVFLSCLAHRYKILISIYLLPLAGAFYSRMVPYPYVALVSLDLSPGEERQFKNSRIVRVGGGPCDVSPTH